MGADDPIVDETVLDGYRMLQEDGAPDVVTELIDVFLEDLPARLVGIRWAVATTDAKQIRSAAHALKGAAASIGAARLAALCGELETIGRSGTSEGAAGFVTPIEDEAKEAVAELRKLRK